MSRRPLAGPRRHLARIAIACAAFGGIAGISLADAPPARAYPLGQPVPAETSNAVTDASANVIVAETTTTKTTTPAATPPASAKTIAATTPVPTTDSTTTEAAPPAPGAAGDTLSASVSVLIRLFVLAVILESALAVVFNWRPYSATFDTRTTNPLIMFFAALGLVALFNLDQVGSLMRVYGAVGAGTVSNDDRWASVVVTALVIAGGSAGVNRMLRALGYRAINLDEERPKPPKTEAWLAVIDTSAASTQGTYDILTSSAGEPWAVIGSITRPPRRPAIIQWLFRNPRRFPHSGGLSVPVNAVIAVAVKPQGSSVPVSVWGPNALSAGAIVDITIDLARIADTAAP